MARLIVVDGPDLGIEYSLDDLALSGRGLVIGRDPRANVPLDDQAVSREHCRIERTRRGFRVVDLESRNRTYLNGDPIAESTLRSGDRLRVGDTDLRFEDDAEPLEDGAASTIIKEIPAGVSAPFLAEAAEVGATKVGAANGAGDRPSDAHVRLRRVLAGVESVLDGAKRMGRTRSANDLLGRYLEVIVEALGADHGAFVVKEHDRWVARARLSAQAASLGGRDADPAEFRPSLSVVERAANEQRAVLISIGDAPTSADSMMREAIRSALAAPVLEEDGPLGVVYLDRRGGDGAFDAADLGLLRASTEPLAAFLARIEAEDRLAEANRNLLRSITDQHRIIGESDAIRGVLEFIERAAPTPMTVLIEGETGTGKELVASAIHYHSDRRGRPFVALNCAALPENIVESELFGHERGAFTGALARKKGRFELATTGTIFLDEIGELGLACQAKLLRVLEERRFERVGGGEPIEVDVRIVAATNKDLETAVAEGTFREDLLYRLSVLRIRLPALRERREDVSLLVDHFLSQAASAGRPRKLAKAALKKLEEYEWPGNVRQLRNVIESATVLGSGTEIRAGDLVLPTPRRGADQWQPISLAELEKQHVLRVLEHTKGNKKRAAEILGIERCTLYSKLRSYDAQED